MDSATIRQRILASQTLREAIERGNDQLVADALTESAPRVATDELYTDRALFAALGPILADSILTKLEAFAATGNSGASVVKRALTWLAPANGGLNFQDATVQQFIAGIGVAGILTAEEVAALAGVGTVAGVVTIADVGEAVRVWRPDGKICPIVE